jgi:hypothetical protein
MRNVLFRRRGFRRDAKVESRVPCICELCQLSHGRLLYPRSGGQPLRFGRIPGFSTNFPVGRAIR